MSLEEQHHDAEIIHVETASANTPAVQLYKKLGYGEVSRREVPGGPLISRFRKNLL
jgi:ribosomal protein S18 acetylase RimI-like enzyme